MLKGFINPLSADLIFTFFEEIAKESLKKQSILLIKYAQNP